MTKALLQSKNEFLKRLYKKNKKLRSEALRCILKYRADATNIAHPIKGIWSNFYAEPRGKYVHATLSTHLLHRQGSLCCYCRDKIFHKRNCNIEHILPIKHYPMFAFEYKNLAAACLTCNALKGDEDFFNIVGALKKYDSNVMNCFHPVLHSYDDHVDFMKIQTNHIYVRVFSHRTAFGERLCSEHLKKVSIFNIKERSNPVVAEAVRKLGEHLDGAPGYECASSTLKRLAANI
ncbi:HNH endonuclease [Pseudomonas syringae pv. atrofaciens]|uniref:HNH endonuclease n=1 Tax=Pseudomonas syringae TaxID=317 RepID=UPI00351DB887